MFDYVILSTNDNPMYKDFWSIVRRAWKLCFPKIGIKLAHITNKPDHTMSHQEDIITLPIIPGIPEPNQSKVARLFIASMQGSKVCMINDIDLIPLTHVYSMKIINARKPNTILCVGGDLYAGGQDDGKFPMGYVTAEGYLFREICNPNNLSWEEFVKSFIGLKVFDSKEDISNPIINTDPNCFSDESLMRVLLHRYPNKQQIHRVNRQIDYDGWNTICRVYHKNYDEKRLRNGKYWQAHLPRPYKEHKEYVDKLMKYLEEVYGG